MAKLNPSHITPSDPNIAIYWIDRIRTRTNNPMTDQANLLSARQGVSGKLPSATDRG